MTEPTLPMSPAQQGMYFDSQLRQSADYHIAIELYTEHLSRSRLTQAVSAVMAEQPALRAPVARNESGPVYTIAESVEAPVRHHDLTGAEENLDKIFHTARHTPFQLNTAPPCSEWWQLVCPTETVCWSCATTSSPTDSR